MNPLDFVCFPRPLVSPVFSCFPSIYRSGVPPTAAQEEKKKNQNPPNEIIEPLTSPAPPAFSSSSAAEAEIDEIRERRKRARARASEEAKNSTKQENPQNPQFPPIATIDQVPSSSEVSMASDFSIVCDDLPRAADKPKFRGREERKRKIEEIQSTAPQADFIANTALPSDFPSPAPVLFDVLSSPSSLGGLRFSSLAAAAFVLSRLENDKAFAAAAHDAWRIRQFQRSQGPLKESDHLQPELPHSSVVSSSEPRPFKAGGFYLSDPTMAALRARDFSRSTGFQAELDSVAHLLPEALRDARFGLKGRRGKR